MTGGEPRYPYVRVEVTPDEEDLASVALFDLGAAGVEVRDTSTLLKSSDEGTVALVASFATEAGARDAVCALAKRWPARIEHVVGDAWRDAWRAFFKPQRLGKRLVIRPSWEPVDARPRDVVLVIDPGRAFGSGTHATTRLALLEIDARVREGIRVLDVGTGSGILAIASVLLGAESALAIDVDPDAIAVTRENARANGVASRVRAATTPVTRVRGRYDLVIANIESLVLVPLAEAIKKRVAPGGVLVLGGILEREADHVAEVYRPLRVIRRRTEDEWASLVLARGRRPK